MQTGSLEINTNITPELHLPPGKRPLIIVSGYTWGEEHSMSPVRDELQQLRDAGVFVADVFGKKTGDFHDFSELGFDPEFEPNATELLAAEVLWEIKKRGLENTPLDALAFSYGSLIYETAVQLSKRLGWKALVADENIQDDRRSAVFLAPAGSREGETFLRITSRYVKNVGKFAIDHWKDQKSAIKEQLSRQFTEIPQRIKEAIRLGKDVVDYEMLAANGILMHRQKFERDGVFRMDEKDDMFTDKASVSYLNKRGAVHSSPLIEPKDNAQAAQQMFEADANGNGLYPQQFSMPKAA